MNSCADLLAAAFAVLRAEASAHHDALCASLTNLAITIVTPAETLSLGTPGAPPVTIHLTPRVLASLLEGRCSLLAAIDAGELDLSQAAPTRSRPCRRRRSRLFTFIGLVHDAFAGEQRPAGVHVHTLTAGTPP